MATPSELAAAAAAKKQNQPAPPAPANGAKAKKVRTSKVPENETKEDRFKRIVVKRTKLCIKFLNNIGNCSNTAVYGYTPEQINHVFDTIKKAYDNAKEKFAAKEATKQADEFSL